MIQGKAVSESSQLQPQALLGLGFLAKLSRIWWQPDGPIHVLSVTSRKIGLASLDVMKIHIATTVRYPLGWLVAKSEAIITVVRNGSLRLCQWKCKMLQKTAS